LENGDAVAEQEIIDPGERTAEEEMADAEERDLERWKSRTSSATVCNKSQSKYLCLVLEE
jgi:hypothetical protein